VSLAVSKDQSTRRSMLRSIARCIVARTHARTGARAWNLWMRIIWLSRVIPAVYPSFIFLLQNKRDNWHLSGIQAGNASLMPIDIKYMRGSAVNRISLASSADTRRIGISLFRSLLARCETRHANRSDEDNVNWTKECTFLRCVRFNRQQKLFISRDPWKLFLLLRMARPDYARL